jgi:hypothetical protein
MPKYSRLVRKLSGPDFKWHLKTGQENRPKDDHLNTGLSGIRRGTVYKIESTSEFKNNFVHLLYKHHLNCSQFHKFLTSFFAILNVIWWTSLGLIKTGYNQFLRTAHWIGFS